MSNITSKTAAKKRDTKDGMNKVSKTKKPLVSPKSASNSKVVASNGGKVTNTKTISLKPNATAPLSGDKGVVSPHAPQVDAAKTATLNFQTGAKAPLGPTKTGTITTTAPAVTATIKTAVINKPKHSSDIAATQTISKNTDEILRANLARKVDKTIKSSRKFWIYFSFLFIFPIFRYRRLKRWFFVENQKLVDQISMIDKSLTQKFNLICNQFNIAKKYFNDDFELEGKITESFSFLTKPSHNNPFATAEKDKIITKIDNIWNKTVTAYPVVMNIQMIQDIDKMIDEIDSELSIQRKFYIIVARDFNSKVISKPLIPVKYNFAVFPVLEKEVMKRVNAATFRF